MPSLAPRHPVLPRHKEKKAGAAPRKGGSLVTHNEPATASLWDSFRIQSRVIGAMLMREILTRYGRKNIGFLWLFVEPMLFALTISLIWTVIRVKSFEGIPLFAFVLVSYLTVPLWRRTVSRCSGAIEANRSLLYHRHVSVLDFYFTRILLEVAGATMALVGLVLLCALFGVVPLPFDPLQVVAGWLMLAWFGFGLALLVGSIIQRAPLLQKAWQPFSLVLFLTSAVFFPAYVVPAAGREILLWSPLVSGIEYLREGYFGPLVPYYYNMFYMAVFNLLLTVFGLVSVRLLGNRITAD